MIKNTKLLGRRALRIMLILGFMVAGHSLWADAAKSGAVDPKVEKRIIENLEQSRPDIKVSNVSTSPIAGLFKVEIINGPVLYITENAEYFVAGDLFQIAPGRLVNVSESERGSERLAALGKVDKDDMIIFSPKGEVKTHITVFTDIDCGYCRMLHQEVPELNKMGIEVRYMAFPRAGVGSDSHKKLATAWCAKNPQEALTKLKGGEALPFKVCDDNPVAEHYELGQRLGVNATPALVTETGELQMGYMKAPQLAARLGVAP